MGVDKKTVDETALVSPDGTEILRLSVSPFNANTNRKILFSDLAAWINSLGGATVIEKTVVEMQALKAGSLLVDGALYRITDAASTSLIQIRALGTSEIEPFGQGLYLNSAMGSPVKAFLFYDLDNDWVSRVVTESNDITATFLLGLNSIKAFPFDNPRYANNYLANFQIANASATAAFNFNSGFYGGTLDLQDSATIETGFIGMNTSIMATGTSAFIGGKIGSNCNVLISGNSAFSGCEIGDGKVFTAPTNYSFTGGVYVGDGSTFECNVHIDLDGLTTLDITNVGGDNYSFCGIFTNVGNNGVPVTIDTLTTGNTDHKYKFINDGTGRVDYSNGVSFLTAGGFTLRTILSGDCMGVIFNNDIGVWVQTGDSFQQ